MDEVSDIDDSAIILLSITAILIHPNSPAIMTIMTIMIFPTRSMIWFVLSYLTCILIIIHG